MKYFPFFMELSKQSVLLIGGGEVAERKLDLLLKANASVTIVSPEFTSYIEELFVNKNINPIKDYYNIKYLTSSSFAFVIAATNDESLNEQVAKDANDNKILVNVVDKPKICDFIFPSILERGPITVAVSTGGSSPVLARMLRTKLETMIPGAYGRLAKIVSENRIPVRKKLVNSKSNGIFWEQMLNGKFLELVLSGQDEEAVKFLNIEIDNFDEQKKGEGEVYLVGAGPGDPDLLTFRALRLMQQADVALYDRLVHPSIIDLIRRDAEKIYVGKQRDNHTVRQEEINELLVKYAKEGKRVLRLKGGDPFIFGRGGEEIDSLVDNNISFQVVPGITSASGCSAYSGIPLTHRDHAQSCIFVTGHLKEGKLDLNWEKLIQPNQTIVFYMGLVSIDIICSQLIKFGLDPKTPCALVEQGTTRNQKVYTSTVDEMNNLVEQEKPSAPTIFIIGHVVTLRDKLNWYKSD
ncbi:MAG: uroporphyrinogen-III C-methyltransferase [Gammaproteobacteria bacterium]|nr:uroporphyrinogen-III C-methyltransferase [Gammaproteobacteria bacterium]